MDIDIAPDPNNAPDPNELYRPIIRKLGTGIDKEALTSISMSNGLLQLFCHILGDSSDRIFPVKIASTESVGGLKQAIKAQKSLTFQAIEADALDLYQVSISIKDFDAKLANARSPEDVEGSAKLHPWDELQECLSSPLKKHIHVILQRPKAATISASSSADSNVLSPDDGRLDVVDKRTRKWTVNGVIHHADANGCYFLDPGTQHASQACLDAIIADQFVLLWGARASGKSTRLLWLQKKLEDMGYQALYATLESVVYDVDSDTFWKSMGVALRFYGSRYPSLPPISISSQTDFVAYFEMTNQKVVLLIDEFSELYRAPPHIRDECLKTFRSLKSYQKSSALRSIIVAGTFSILYLNPTDTRISPFNITDHVASPYFSLDETRKLFTLFAEDYSIMIDDDIVVDVWFKSNGHPGMVCLCGRTMFKSLKLLLDKDLRTMPYQKWQQFPTQKLYRAISGYSTFNSMIDSLLLLESHAAVVLLRSRFAGYLQLVEVTGEDETLANFLTVEGVLLRPDITEPHFRMASPLLDGVIRDRVIHTKFPSAPLVAPPRRDNDEALNVLDVLIESLKFIDKDLIRLAVSRSYKTSPVNICGSLDRHVPRESVYDTELMRILSNWLQGDHGWTVTGQWHLKNKFNQDRYPNIVIKKPGHPTVILELLATGDRHFIQSHIEKTPEYMALLSADEAWVVHFTCQEPFDPVWESPAGLGGGVNIVHFVHNLAFANVLMSARWQDHAGNIMQVVNQPLSV